MFTMKVIPVLMLLAFIVPSSAQGQSQTRRKVIRLDEISVEGRIQKPQAFYILPRSSLNYEALQQDESFLPRIERSLEKEPF